MAEQSLDVKTDEIYGRRNEKGKEAKNYQDAEKQLLAIQAAQQQNLKAGKINNLAQYQNSQNLINAGNAMNQANASKPQTQQVTVNQPTQQILQKYGATKPGTVTKTTHSQQVTKQNITINNNTTNTTNNQIKTIPNQVSQAIRPQKDNSNEKFKLWLNNTLARQQEEYARREKDYDKRESALTRDSNKMLRKLGEFSKDMMEKMDPRNIGSTATSQIKSLLFIFGFQYLASNWVKILKTVGSIEDSFKRGLAYIGLYNMRTKNFEFSPGRSQLAYDIAGLFTGDYKCSPLMVRRGGSGSVAPQIGGEKGWVGDLRKMLFGDSGGKEGGKDKGLINIIKDFFVLQGKKRIAAAKMIEKPEFPISNPGAGIEAMEEYFGQLLRIFLGDPEEALREKIVSKISLDSRYRSLAAAGNAARGTFSGDNYSSLEDEVNTKTGRHFDNVRRGSWAILHGSNGDPDKRHKGITAMTINDEGRLYKGSAESSIGQAADILLATEDAEEGKALDTGRIATGFWRLNERAKDEGTVAVQQEFVSKYLSPEDIKKLQDSGDLKEGKYEWVVRYIDKKVDDTHEDHLHAGDRAVMTMAQTEKSHYRRVPVRVGELGPWDESTGEQDILYELTPAAIKYILQSKLGEKAKSDNFDIDLSNRNYTDAIGEWAINIARENEALRNPKRFVTDTREYTAKGAQLYGNPEMTEEERDIWNRYNVYVGKDKNTAESMNSYNRMAELRKGDQWFAIHVKNTDGKNVNGGEDNLIVQAFNNAVNSVDITSRNKELSGYDVSFGEGTDNDDKVHGLMNDYLPDYDFSKFLTGTRKSTGEVINFGAAGFRGKYRTGEELEKLLSEISDFNFKTDDVSKLITGSNSKYKIAIADQINKSLHDYSKEYLKKLDIKINTRDFVTPDELDNPEKLQSKLNTFFKKYIPANGEYLAANGNKVKLDDLKSFGTTTQDIITKMVSGYDYLVNHIDEAMALQKQNAVTKILTELRNNRVSADAIYQKDLEFVEKLKADPNARFTAAHGTNMEHSLDIQGMWDNYDSYKSEFGELDRQFSQDVDNNSAASGIRDVIRKGSGVLYELGEMTSEAKDWLGSQFGNAKEVFNNFAKQVSYPSISITKYPSGYKFTKKDNLLIWHAFNGAYGKDVEDVCKVDFQVWDESGRFGAGRNDSEPYTSLSSEKTTFDRLHSGQDISTFYLNDKPYPSTQAPRLYAPFNGYLISIRTDNGGTGRHILLRQTTSENRAGGRYGIFVCHMSRLTPETIKHFQEGTMVNRGEELGAMGGSGKGGEDKASGGYPRHFHINVLDFDHPGPLDGPFEYPLPLVSPKWRGFSTLGPGTRICNEHAVDPLFVYVNPETGEAVNRTLYLTEDKKIVDIESYDKTGKGVNSEGKGLFSGNESDDEGSEDGSDDKKEDKNKSFLERTWDWLKEMYMKYLSGGVDSFIEKAKEVGTGVKDFTKEFFGKYRNKSMSFRRSSRSYSGEITPEFINYKNYVRDPRHIPTKPDGTLLSEAEWRNEVFDMTGSDPISLELGEYIHNGRPVKTADQVGGSVQETVNKYSDSDTESTDNSSEVTNNTENNNEQTTNTSSVTENTDVVNISGSIAKELKDNGGLTNLISSFGADTQAEIAKNTAQTVKELGKLAIIMGANVQTLANSANSILGATDQLTSVTAANALKGQQNVTVVPENTGNGNSRVV